MATRSTLPQIRGKSEKMSSNMNYAGDEEEDVDDDGYPLTTNAARRIYHQNQESKILYCAKKTYSNPLDSLK